MPSGIYRCANNNLATQRAFETLIFFRKSRHHLYSYSDYISYRHDFSIYRKEDVLFQLKIRHASEKFKNQPRPLLGPRSINFRQHFRNLSNETVPLKARLTNM
jgi:hypothetical protein